MLKYILISFLIITNVYAYTCEEMGYTKSIADCPDGGLKCPAEPEKMFCCDPCGNTGAFMYNERNCSPDDGLQLAGIQCGGGWTKCEQCPAEYKYNKDNCRSPKILAGVQCANSYTQCVYPVGSGCVPTVGYIYYSDGSCHADYDDTKIPVGIIVDAARKTIVALDEQTNISWNDGTAAYKDVTDLPNMTKEQGLLDMDGQGNTDKIIAFAHQSGQEQKAAEYCANKKDFNRKWYLPALGELNILYSKVDEVQVSLINIPESTQLTLSKYYWSSTESNGARAWEFKPFDGISTNGPCKNEKVIARCFSSF